MKDTEFYQMVLGLVAPWKVKEVRLEMEQKRVTVEVEVEFAGQIQDEGLLVGYSADVEIVHDTRKGVLRIPTQTLMEGKRVLLYRPDGLLEERKVVTGLSNWEHTEIISGLNESDQIVTSLDRAGAKAGARAIPEAAVPSK